MFIIIIIIIIGLSFVKPIITYNQMAIGLFQRSGLSSSSSQITAGNNYTINFYLIKTYPRTPNVG